MDIEYDNFIERCKYLLAEDTITMTSEELEDWIKVAKLLILKIRLFEFLEKRLYFYDQVVNHKSQIENRKVPDDVRFDHR